MVQDDEVPSASAYGKHLDTFASEQHSFVFVENIDGQLKLLANMQQQAFPLKLNPNVQTEVPDQSVAGNQFEKHMKLLLELTFCKPKENSLH